MELDKLKTDDGFVSMYIVDLDSNTFEMQRVNGLREDVKDVVRQNVSFTSAIGNYIDTFCSEEDKELLRMVTEKNYIISRLTSQTSFAVEYQVKKNPDNQVHFELHIIRAVANWDEHKIIIGWKCVDSRYNEIAKQAGKLEEAELSILNQQKMFSALTDVYVSIHIVNMKTNNFRELNSKSYVHDAVGNHGNAQEAFNDSHEKLVRPAYRDKMMEFTDLSTLDRRLKEKNIVSREFEGTHVGWCRANFIVITRDEDGNVETVFYLVQSIDDEKKKELEYQRQLKTALESKNAMYQQLIEMQLSGVVAVNELTNEIITMNQAALKFFGLKSVNDCHKNYHELLAMSMTGSAAMFDNYYLKMKNPGDSCEHDMTIKRPDKSVVKLLVQSQLVQLKTGAKMILCTMTDITERKKMEDELSYLSKIDGLTKIFNRSYGEKMVEKALEEKEAGMFCLFDIDNFKGFNDSYGHIMGDKVLIAIAKCISDTFTEDSINMRLGGDEFAIYAKNITDVETAKMRMHELMTAVDNVSIEGLDRKVTISAGVTLSDGTKNFDTLYQSVDKSMYAGKKEPGNSMVMR